MFVNLYQITWAWKDAYTFFYLVVIWCYVYSFQFKSQTFLPKLLMSQWDTWGENIIGQFGSILFHQGFRLLAKGKKHINFSNFNFIAYWVYSYLMQKWQNMVIVVMWSNVIWRMFAPRWIISFHLFIRRHYMSKIQWIYTFTLNSELKGHSHQAKAGAKVKNIKEQVKKIKEQDCIPVGCAPPACCPYLPACTAWGVCSQGGLPLVWGGVPVSGPGGCLPLVRGGVSQHAMGQNPSSPLWTEWQIGAKLLPNFVCGQ